MSPAKHDTDKKRLLARRNYAVKALVAQTDWLEAPRIVSYGRICHKDGSAFMVIDSELLASTQRRLFKIRQDREAADSLLGDHVVWLEKRQRLLDEAKILVALKVPEQCKTLTDWLNALVVNAVVISPCGAVGNAIGEFGQQACPALLSLMHDEALPLLSRTLAAMVLGKIHGGGKSDRLPASLRAPHILCAYKFGAAHGIDDRSALSNRLLLEKDGTNLALRVRTAWKQARWSYTVDDRALQWMIEDASPLKLVELLENLAKTVQVEGRIQRLSLDFSKWPAKRTEQMNDLLKQTIDSMLAAYGHCCDFALESRDVSLPLVTDRLFLRIIDCIESIQIGRQLLAQTLSILRDILVLPLEVSPQMSADCLRLVEFSTSLWQMEDFKGGNSNLYRDLTAQVSHDLKPITRLLQTTGDADLIRRAVKSNCIGGLGHQTNNKLDHEMVAGLVSVMEALPVNASCQRVQTVIDALWACRGSSHARTALKQLVTCLRGTPQAFNALIDIIELMEQSPTIGLRAGLQLAAKLMPVFVDCCRRKELAVDRYLWAALGTILALRAYSDTIAIKMAPCVIDELTAHDKPMADCWNLCVSSTWFAGFLSGGDEQQYRQVFKTALAKKFYLQGSFEWTCLRVFAQAPVLLGQIRRAFLHHPGRCSALFEQMQLAYKLGIPLIEVWNSLEGTPPSCICPSCQTSTTFSDEIQKYWRGYVFAQASMGGVHDLPHSITKLIQMPERIAKELHFLEKENPPSSRKESVQKRIDRLRFYKQFPLTLQADIAMNVRRELEKAESQAFLEASTYLLKQAIEGKFATTQMEALGLTREQLFDLLVLRCTIDKSKNRGELRRLLTACMRGDLRWPFNQPANRRYLSEMTAQNFNVETWTSAFPAYINLPDTKTIKISIEQNPIEVLKMGVYFDTCLSLDGINAFSCIANATDINKRVIYARDSKGKVIGRKLIAISENWKLMGYLTYMTPGSKVAVHGAIEEYAKAFASACGIPLGEGEQVKTLVSKSWYDDGTVSWDSERLKDSNSQEIEIPLICFGDKKRR